LLSAPLINGAAGLSGPTTNPAASDPFSSQQHAVAQPDSVVESGTPIPGLGVASSQQHAVTQPNLAAESGASIPRLGAAPTCTSALTPSILVPPRPATCS
jgi:hypothetical protein